MCSWAQPADRRHPAAPDPTRHPAPQVKTRRERELRRVQADLESLEKQREQLQTLLAVYAK
jgi:hypothetical protein